MESKCIIMSNATIRYFILWFLLKDVFIQELYFFSTEHRMKTADTKSLSPQTRTDAESAFSCWGTADRIFFLPVTRSIDRLLFVTAEHAILYRAFLHICVAGAHASVGCGNTSWPHMEVRIPRRLIEEEEIPTRTQAFAFTLNSRMPIDRQGTRARIVACNFKANHNADVTGNHKSDQKNRHSRLHHVRGNRSSDRISRARSQI